MTSVYSYNATQIFALVNSVLAFSIVEPSPRQLA